MTELKEDDVRRIVAEYTKSDDFRGTLANQFYDVLRPTVYGCSISYNMGGTQTGRPTPWTWGYTTYDKGGYHGGTNPKIVVPPGLGGLYMILADVTVTPQPASPATALDINITVVSSNVMTTGGGIGTVSFGSSSAPLDWSSSKFLELDDGDSISITGGASSLTATWKSDTFTNHLTAIRFPFG